MMVLSGVQGLGCRVVGLFELCEQTILEDNFNDLTIWKN